MRDRSLAAAACLVSVAVCSGIVALITPAVPARATGVVYLLGVLAVSSLFGLTAGLVASGLSVVALNFLFISPHSFMVDRSGELLSLLAFAAAAAIGSELAARVRRQGAEATQRAGEAELGERLATLVAAGADLESALPAVARQAARALGASEGVIHLGAPAPASRAGQTLTLEVAGARVGELRLIGCPPGALETPAADRIGRAVGSLILLARERDRHVAERVEAEALRRSNALKTVLLRAVSHDLRSPLMAITAAAGGLQYANLDEDERELLRTIAEQGDRMSRMVENLLDLSRLQAGAAAPHADWIDPRDLVEAAIDELTPDEQRARVALDLDHHLPLVRGDGAQLQRVIVNVVENALKFSPPDAPVEVAVGLAPDRVTIAVADHGPGIPAAEVPSVFEPFYRSSLRRDTPGSGLGLAIARGLAAANGCTLELEHTGDGGSTFVIAIPTAAEPPA